MRLPGILRQSLRGWFDRTGVFVTRPAPSSASELKYDLARLQPCNPNVRIDGGSISVAKAPATWSFLANLKPDPQSRGDRYSGPASMIVTLEVTAGTVGLMLLENGTSEGAIDETLVRPEDGLTTVRLFVPNFSTAGQLIVRNAGPAGDPIAVCLHKADLTSIDILDAVNDTGALHSFYDLSIYPATFDFGYFLMAAEIARQKAGLKSLRVYIVRPGRDATQRLPDGYVKVVDDDARAWRIPNVLVPILTLFPSVSAYSVLPDRIAASALREHLPNVFPGPFHKDAVPTHLAHRSVNQELGLTPAALRPRASAEGLRFIRQWTAARAGGRKVVTITLRQYQYLPKRNSNMEAWVAFTRELDDKGYFPVIVPDTAIALEPPPAELSGTTVFPEVALNLALRMALYESAYLNLATNGGPTSLLILSDRCPFLMFKLVVPGVSMSSGEDFIKTGFTVGKDPPFLNVRQHIVWEDDDLPVIRREFDAMAARIDALSPSSSEARARDRQ